MGNDKYNGNVSDPQKFNVNRVPTDISVTVKTPITYGDVAVITVELDETINATVKLTVDGKEYDVAIINGKGGFNASGLNSGNHKVNVTYAGDDKYVGSENSTSFNVDNATLVADVTAFNVTVEQNTTFVINVTDDFNGNVSIKVGDKVLYNGSAKTLILADVLSAGDKTATVVFYGDSNYDELTLNDVKFTVSRVDPSIDVVIDDVTYPDKAVAFIYVGNDANGTVNITVDGKVFSGTVSKGVAQVDLTGLSAGSKVASVEFFATDDYNDNATASAKFTVLKANTTLDVEFKPIIYVNETQVINITVNNTNATGNVTIMIDGKNYTATLINGRANFTTDLLPYGNHTLTVIYEGDKNLTGSLISKTIEVIKLQSDLTISVTNITTASDETIKVNVTTGTTGSVVITVDGKDYYVDLDNGVATLVLSNLANKTYTVHAKYLGDDNYTTCEGDASFNVAKVNSTVSVKVENITVGDVAVVNITIPADATGNVTVEIDGVGTYTVPVAGGTGLWVVKDLEVGTYTVKVTYNGDDNYLPSNNETTFKVSKAESGDIKVVDQGNRTVVITVPGKDGNVTVKVGNNTYNATVVDGVATVDLVNETPGPKDITVFYSGDENNPNATANATVNIPKYDTPMSIEVANSTVGNVTTVIVNVPKDVKGNVTVSIDGKTYSVKPVDGKAVFEIEGLIAGNKTVAASYAGDDWFVANSTVAHFKVDKVASSVNVTGDVINVGENATITITGPKDYNGTAVVNVDGKNYTVSISNGIGQIEVSGLANGTYDVKVTLLETDKYLGSDNDTAKVLVNKVESFVTVNVDNITVGDVAVIKVTVPDDATGNVTVTIGNITRTVPIAGGENEIIVPGVPVGDYDVKVTYNGDGKYLPANATASLSVKPVETDPADIKVVDQGNGTVVVVVPEDATGNVTITINGTNYTSPVVNGTATFDLTNETPGTYDITATYSGDENYTSAAADGTVTIPKYTTAMSVEVSPAGVGNVTKVIVSVPENVTGNVTVEIDGKTYSVKPVDGQAVFEIEGLTAGNKTVVASYAGDDWYLANSTTAQFTVDKVASSVNVTGDVINVGETATIVISAPSDFNGTAVVTIDEKDYSVNVTNGAGQLKVDGLANATYDVKVTLMENDKYLSSSNDTAKVIVNKVTDAEITASADNITVGDPAVIKVTVPEDATGNVTVTIGNITRTVPISGGENEIIVPDVPVGDYDVKVTYNGDDKYLPANTTTPLSVKPAETSPDDIKVVDQGNGTVVITVPGNDGNVTVKLGDETYNATVVNGTAVVTLTNATPGVHEIDVVYSGDENHTGASTKANVTIPKYETPMSIEVVPGKVGETTTVTVNVPENATGNVDIEINGKTYSKEISDGKAVFEIDGLLSGNKTVIATYSGDDNYAFNSTTANFTVDKNPAPISVEVDNSTNGQATVTVTLPEDATGYVIVNVGGTDYGINLTAGDKSVTIPIKGTGDYTADVIYLGDEKYLGNATSVDFHVSSNKTSPNIGAEVDNVPVGEDVKVKVTIPEGGDGNVTVTVDNITVTAPVTGGENIITIPGVSEGTHDVNISYSGNDQYDPQNVTKSVKVFKSIIAENITRGWNSPYDYKAEFLDKNGHVLPYTDVQFTVNGKTYTVKTDSQGIAFLDTSKLAVGKYDVTIINPVTGEERTATTTIVKRLIENKDITMDFVDGTYYTVRAIGDDGKPVGEGEFVDIYVHTIHYSCKTNKDGYARLKINLNPGKYTITAEYKNTKVSNKLVVKQTLKLVKKTVKVKKGKKLVLKAKLKWSNGKAIKGKIIKFTFKGKTYKAKTNSKGIAKVTIKKKVTKKLKKGKKYAYSAKYLTNIVKGKVKVK
jgi:hypothetical protein